MVKLPLLYEDIIKILPHRYPFLLVDRVTELELHKRVVGIKNVSANEPFFQGHFPGNPIMPGVLIIEAMAQVGGVLARMSRPEVLERTQDGPIFFMAMDKVKFRRPVIPGDQIVFELEALRTGSKVWKMAGKAFVQGSLVAEAELLATIG
ncbi:MAG: 3-hydroxyacyl-ACP dehydratase FabZ [Thermodesulfobacteriota bacterium]